MGGRMIVEGRGGKMNLQGLLGTPNGDRGPWRFRGVAATVGVDREGDRITEEALRQVAAGGAVRLVGSHRPGAATLGVVEEMQVRAGRLEVSGTLDPGSAEARKMAGRLRRERQGLSLGGRVREVREDGGGRVLEAIEVEHVAVCEPRSARNGETYVVME